MNASQEDLATRLCPGSVTVEPVGVTRWDWLQTRRQGIGGSEFPILLGLTPPGWGTPYGLWLDKTGHQARVRDTAVMAKGRDLEPVVLEKFAEQAGLELCRVGMQRSRACWRMQYTPDAFTTDGACVEAKLVSRFGRDRWADGVPVMYEWQLRYGLAVTGATRGFLVVLDEDSWQLSVQEIQARPEDFDLCAATVTRFWAHVENGTPPPIDPDRVSCEELLSRYRIIGYPDTVVEAEDADQARVDVARYAALTAVEATARAGKTEKEEIKARLLGQIGDAEYLAIEGVPVLQWKQVRGNRFRERDFKLEHPLLAADYTDTTPTRRLHLLAAAVGPESA